MSNVSILDKTICVHDANSALPFPMSSRSLLRWAKMPWAFRDAKKQGISPVYSALDRAFLNAANGDTDIRPAIVKPVVGKFGPNRGA